MDGLINSLLLSEMIVSPVLNCAFDGRADFEKIKLRIVNSLEMNEVTTFEDCYYYMMSGFCIFIMDGESRGLACGIQGWEKRRPDDPTNESNIRGAKECFVEALNDNKAMLRRRLKTPHLKLKQLCLGSAAKTPVVLAYVDDRADSALVQNVEQRLRKAALNTLIDYGELVPFLDTDIKSFFSGVGNTERPDVLVSKLLEGRVAVLIEGTPFALYVPSLFSDSFQSVDDYNNPPFYSGFVRALRFMSFALSVFLPGVYVAIGSFHQELIPTGLLFTVASEEISTPFSLMNEAVLLLLLYEIMREAGLRLPRAVGHAVSIIGGIIIGETTVEAGITGAPMLVVVALTAISSYVVYQMYESVSVLRFLFVIAGGLTGMYGIVAGACVLFVNISALNPYGVPYSAPVSPLTKSSAGDVFYRESWKKLARRAVRVQRLRGASIDREKR
jgi:spore germination protein KA